MIISVWRYSHLALAISSFLLLIVASISGIVLAFEPIIEKSRPFKAESFDTTTLAQSIPVLKERFAGIQEVSVDDYDFVLVKYSAEEGGDQAVYVNPTTGETLGRPQQQQPLFQWMTTLHRSLFMHETGRILIGASAFLLILIAVSGILLVVQRQNGWKHFFSTVEKTGFAQYYHVVFGRLALFFILAIAVTGTYLAVYRFVPPPSKASFKIDEKNMQEEPLRALTDFPAFQQTPLSKLKKLQFPFSDFPEDYYTIQLEDREVCVNQFTGEPLAEQVYSNSYQLAQFSLRWHTGRSAVIWALILAVASGYILFFIYSGFAITLKRQRSRPRNRVKPGQAEIVLLVGSENGSTFRFTEAIYRQLVKHGEKAYLTDLSNFSAFPKAKHLIVMTSTYGQGDAPSNAKKLSDRIQQFPQLSEIQYAVVGFGSRSYQHFCRFAYEVQTMLQATSWAKELLPVHTINDQSPQDFSDWLTAWSRQTGYTLMMPRDLLEPSLGTQETLRVTYRTEPDAAASFIIKLKSRKFRKALSGDLLAIYPKGDHRERHYSIGKINGEIQLSVKLHEHGLGSGFLNALQQGDSIKGKLIKNRHFRFPKKAKEIIMVSNGTGIAPLLGMISENRQKIPIELYCGFPYRSSFGLYEAFLKEQLALGRLHKLHLVLSREDEKEYVSHRIMQNNARVTDVLKNKGVLMICGSLSMQHDVITVLEAIGSDKNELNPSVLIEEGRILTDCY